MTEDELRFDAYSDEKLKKALAIVASDTETSDSIKGLAQAALSRVEDLERQLEASWNREY